MVKSTKQIAMFCISLMSPGIALAAGNKTTERKIAGRDRQATRDPRGKRSAIPRPTGLGVARHLHITLNRDPTSGFFGTVQRPLEESSPIRLNAYVDGAALRRAVMLAEDEQISALEVFGRHAGDWGREDKMGPQWSDARNPNPNEYTGFLRFQFDVPAPSVAEVDRSWAAIHREGVAFRVHVVTSTGRVVDIDMQHPGQNWGPGRSR